MEVHVIHPELKEAIFGMKTRPHLLHQTVVMQLNNRRAGTAATKSKGLARGWKETVAAKGTGRARAGSIRSLLWVGGGTIFGPQRETIRFVCRARHRKLCFQRSA